MVKKNYLQLTNLSLGIATLILFAITGQLMRHYYLNADAPDVERLFRRSRHLFLLMAGLTQSSIGIYIVAHSYKMANSIQWLATGIMTLSTACLSYAFFFEIPDSIVPTPVSRIGLYLLLAGAVLHFGSSLLNSFKSKSNPS